VYLDWIHLAQNREHGNISLVFIKFWESAGWLSNYQLCREWSEYVNYEYKGMFAWPRARPGLRVLHTGSAVLARWSLCEATGVEM
jgi:hypothetical protein